MIRILLMVLLPLIGAGAGVGAGLFLRPEPEPMAEGEKAAEAETEEQEQSDEPSEGNEMARLNNQFVVPVLSGDQVSAMVVLSLSLETKEGGQDLVFTREPRIRDALLQVLFDFANAGGFDGRFTGGDRLDTLRTMLLNASREVIGNYVVRVLITDIARQDV